MLPLRDNAARIFFAGLSALILTALLAAAGLFSATRVIAARRLTDVAAKTPAQPLAHPTATPVLVELFTSEGCSDCPPADALLAHLQQDQPVPSANIIALEEHVDYWDHLGWRDRFSSHELTLRQNEYTRRLRLNDNYTPEMIVDGTDQFVGSDSSHALRAVASAARSQKLPLSVSSLNTSTRQVTGSVSANLPASRQPVPDLYAALVQRSSSTNVLRGENGGHTLRHASTVLALQKLGDAAAARSFAFDLPPNLPPASLAVVVFAQQPSQGAILGAASSPLTAVR